MIEHLYVYTTSFLAAVNPPASPAATSNEWLANFTLAFQRAMELASQGRDIPPTGTDVGFWATVGAGVSFALVTAMSLARNQPGVVGISSRIGMLLYNRFAPDEMKQKDMEFEKRAQVFLEIVSIIEGRDGDSTIKELKAEINKKLPSGLNDEIKNVLALIKQGKLITSTASVV